MIHLFRWIKVQKDQQAVTKRYKALDFNMLNDIQYVEF